MADGAETFLPKRRSTAVHLIELKQKISFHDDVGLCDHYFLALAVGAVALAVTKTDALSLLREIMSLLDTLLNFTIVASRISPVSQSGSPGL